MHWIIRTIFYKPPKVGDIYKFDGGGDPFYGGKYKKRRVLEVKDGWVRYEWIGSDLWKDERKSCGAFHACYVFHSCADTQADTP